MTRRTIGVAAAALVLVAVVLGWLRDPPWIAHVTSGLGPVLVLDDGTRVRWTKGYATFYVPSNARMLELAVRPHRPPPDFLPARVEVSVDGRMVNAVTLVDEQWRSMRVAVERLRTSRRYRRVDLWISSTWGDQLSGILLAEPRIAQ